MKGRGYYQHHSRHFLFLTYGFIVMLYSQPRIIIVDNAPSVPETINLRLRPQP